MATLEQQREFGELMRRTDDVHYRFYLALFTFHAMANYFDEISEERFAEVEKALAEVEDTLVKVRAAMATYLHGELHLA
jgi:hypothetical protein